MRKLERFEYDDLNMVIRALCEEIGITFGAFAKGVAVRAKSRRPELFAVPKGEKKSPKDAYKIVYKFVTDSTNRNIPHLLEDIVEELEETIQHHPRKDRAKEFSAIVRGFKETSDYRKIPNMGGLLQSCNDYLAPSRDNANRRKESQDFRNRIGHAFHAIANAFDSMDKDIDSSDSGIGDSHFICLRSSSQKVGRFVIHGIRFAPHMMASDKFYYFSERHARTRNYPLPETEMRKSTGIAFFDGGHVTGIARPQNVNSLTYLIGHLTESDVKDSQNNFLRFEGMISTTNSQQKRIGAQTLFLRCTSEDDMMSKIGIFEEARLRDILSADQYSLLMTWTKWPRRARYGVIKI